jgi:hypothetical protein
MTIDYSIIDSLFVSLFTPSIKDKHSLALEVFTVTLIFKRGERSLLLVTTVLGELGELLGV